ncbi:MAG: magnesium transporter CorA family protein [Methylobacteriaceae bacterium]|nr:magnesium transporter CorA family protein [Methylobacteriaceae bacterium]
MIFVHRPAPGGALTRAPLEAGAPVPEDAVWIDLVAPARAEDLLVERHLGVEIPTREEQADIEPSEVLYAEAGAAYMTARLVVAVDTDRPRLSAVSFILTRKALVTLRYDEPRSFTMFLTRAGKPEGCAPTPEAVLAGLVESILDRAADVLQTVGDRIDALSIESFDDRDARNAQRRSRVLTGLGREGDLVSKSRESLLTIERMLLFMSSGAPVDPTQKELRARARGIFRDVQALEEHAAFMASKVQFLLDATLGLVNLEQNNIIKLFSVMAVIFMPPTMVASIYGMNFKHMPELDWPFGYPMALALMLASGVLPFLFFKWRRWL